MKKPGPKAAPKTKALPKTKAPPKKVPTIDAYLARVRGERRAALEALRKQIHAMVPGVEEGISYGMPAFRLGRDVVAGFAPTTAGCSYYPFSGSTLDSLASSLSGYSRTKAALHFEPGKGLPPKLLRQLLDTRLAEIARKRG